MQAESRLRSISNEDDFSPLSASVFDNVEPGIVINDMTKSIPVDKNIRRVQHNWSVWPRIQPLRRRRRNEGANLSGTELVADVKNAQTSILVGSKDQIFTDETARTILVNIVGTEMSADLEIVLVRRLGEGGNANRV